MTSLPKTFQQLILVARALEVKYIWIDALCIVQDGLRDWEVESSNMADVYGHSYLTVAAAGASDSSGGLLYGENHEGTGPFQVDTAFTQSFGVEVYVKEKPYRNGLYPVFRAPDAYQWLPMLGRAWIHQEYQLSTRFLQFGRSELKWDCNRISSCCSYFSKEKLPSNKAKFVRATVTSSSHEQTDLLAVKHWNDEVEAYSYKALTKAADKLPAMSGIARRYQHILKCQYLAGLSNTCLLRQLFWMATSPGRRPAEYRAPSFSWASIDGPIRHIPLREQTIGSPFPVIETPTLEILDVHCEPASVDPTGTVSDGFLRVKGKVLEATYIRLPDDAPIAKRPGGSDSRHLVWKDNLTYTFDADEEEVLREGGSSTVYCLRVGLGWTRTPGIQHDYFIVLKPSDRTPGAYERIGWSTPFGTTHQPADQGLAFDTVPDREFTIV